MVKKISKKSLGFLLLLAFGLFLVFSPSQALGAEFARTYGGSLDDIACSIQQTTDGGYIVAGLTYSFGVGNGDMWISKLNSDGTVAWQKTYGGVNYDLAASIKQTSDGGYIVAGCINAGDGTRGDMWVLKLDSNGNVVWQKSYDKGYYDVAGSIQQTSDGGYIVAGCTYNAPVAWQTTCVPTNDCDFWILKLNSDGTVAWQKTYGGSYYDTANCIRQTTDGGYIVLGETASFGTGAGGASINIWALKLNSDGTVAWQKTYGNGSGWARANCIRQTTDGGYIVAGYGYFGIGGIDCWALKLNSDGTVAWQKAYGGTGNDSASSIWQTTDGGYIMSISRTNSFGAGGDDTGLIKLNSDGTVAWQKTYGGVNDEQSSGGDVVQQTTDGGYILAAMTKSFGAGGWDWWILKTNSNGDITGCPYVGTSSPTVTNTSATVINTSVTGRDTTVSPQTSTFSVTNTNANPTTWANAPTGSSVAVILGGDARLTFDNVTSIGNASVVVESPNRVAPANFRIIRGSYYDISATAGYTGYITVTLPYDPANVVGNASRLKLFHWKNNGWEDVTVSVDTVNHTITGRVTSLSPFAVAEASSSLAVPASSIWSLALIGLVGIAMLARRSLIRKHSA